MSMQRRKAHPLLLIAMLGLMIGIPLIVNRSLAQGSWAQYLNLINKDKSGGVKFAAIYGQDGAKWAATQDAKAGEIAAIAAGLKDNSKLRANGITFGGTKYMFLTVRTPEGVVGRKGPHSIILRATHKAIIIVVTTDGANPANITSIDFVADDLKKKNF